MPPAEPPERDRITDLQVASRTFAFRFRGPAVDPREIGRRLGDRDHLLRAESILEEIGAEFDLRAARDALANGE